jgi:uncharacterized oxidoreductase
MRLWRSNMTTHIPAEPLMDFCAEIFARVGCQSEEANRVSASLVDANLTGHDSHGVIRVPRYVDWVRTGDLIPNQSIERVVDTSVIGVVDGRFGFGQTVGRWPSISALKKGRQRACPQSRCATPATSAASASGRSAPLRQG